MTTKPRGRLLVLSGPSGAGKTTVARRLIAQYGGPNGTLVRSVSVTTRRRREGEMDGEDYRFVTADGFQELLAAGDLLEHAEMYGCQYGTPRAFVEDALDRGLDVLLILDAHGRRQLAGQASAELVSVFLLPPALSELDRRLRGRQRDDAATIGTRLQAARQEIEGYREYDHVIRNHDLDHTLAIIDAILYGRPQ